MAPPLPPSAAFPTNTVLSRVPVHLRKDTAPPSSLAELLKNWVSLIAKCDSEPIRAPPRALSLESNRVSMIVTREVKPKLTAPALLTLRLLRNVQFVIVGRLPS